MGNVLFGEGIGGKLTVGAESAVRNGFALLDGVLQKNISRACLVE
jgi:hypothetical protein